MAGSLSPLCFILLSLSLCLRTTAKTLNETCTDATGFVPYHFCMVTLGSNPHSTHANTTTLAFISLNVAIINATSTKAKIHTLLKNDQQELEPSVKNGLQACDIIYSNAITDLKSTGEFLRSAKFETAKALVSAASRAGYECRDALPHAGVMRRSLRLLRKENGDLGLLTLLFLAVIN